MLVVGTVADQKRKAARIRLTALARHHAIRPRLPLCGFVNLDEVGLDLFVAVADVDPQ